jgi:hypothetical protein
VTFELGLYGEGHLKRQRRDGLNEQLADRILKGGLRDLLAHRLAAYGKTAKVAQILPGPHAHLTVRF